MVNAPYLNAAAGAAVYENSFSLAIAGQPSSSKPPASHTRGKVGSFSQRSRRRLFKLLSRVRISELHSATFLTLTYHYAHENPSSSAQEDLNTFLSALRRDYPQAVYIWRLEFQKRGAPHYHLMIWHQAAGRPVSCAEIQDWTRRTWHRIADPSSEAHVRHGVRCDEITSYRGAVTYLAKYAAKEESYAPDGFTGRRWGASRKLPVAPHRRLQLEPQTFYILRRLARKLLKSRGAIPPRFDKHLRNGTSLHYYISRTTSEQLLRAAELIRGRIEPPRASPFQPKYAPLIKWLRDVTDRAEEAHHLHRVGPLDELATPPPWMLAEAQLAVRTA